MDFVVPADCGIEIKENEKIEKYLYLAIDLKTLWNMRRTMIQIVIGLLEAVHKGLKKKNGKIRNQRKGQDHPDHCIVKIS